MRKHDAFFVFLCSVLLMCYCYTIWTKTHSLFGWGVRFWNALGFWLGPLLMLEWSFYWLIASHLPSGACCVFGGGSSLMWSWAQVLFLVLLVPPSLEPFWSKSHGEEEEVFYPFWTAVQTTGWCVRGASSGKAVILQATSGLTPLELCTICTGCMKGRGQGKSKVGRRRWKMEQHLFNKC